MGRAGVDQEHKNNCSRRERNRDSDEGRGGLVERDINMGEQGDGEFLSCLLFVSCFIHSACAAPPGIWCRVGDESVVSELTATVLSTLAAMRDAYISSVVKPQQRNRTHQR